MESTSTISGNKNNNNNNNNNSNSNSTNDRKNVDFDESKDDVDCASVATNNNNNNNINYTNNKIGGKKLAEHTTTTTATTAVSLTDVSDNNNSCGLTNGSPASKTNNKQEVDQQQQQQHLPVPPKETASNKNNNNNNSSSGGSNTLKKKKKVTTSTTTTEEGQPEKKPSSTRERLSLFSFHKKPSHKHPATEAEKGAPVSAPPPAPRPHKFVKSSSLARLLGNTYNAKKFEKEEQRRLQASAGDGKFNTYAGRRRLSGPTLERFRSKEDGDDVATWGLVPTTATAATTTTGSDLCGGGRRDLPRSASAPEQKHQGHGHERHADFGAKAMRTLSRGLGRLWWRRSHSVDISTPDPEFKVSYLGNVLTGWAKGEGCVEKQLSTLWRNYTQNNKPDVLMRIRVCASGLKATTRQHGLTEYWANRITHCCAPKNYPRVFCWIYRHEGRKLKHELRCHAVLCSKEKVVQDICSTLKENLERALREFRREKILKQNARLSLANAAYENPSLPRRKILLSVGGNNYRPPLERSKSAPKLMAIEEAVGEEDGEEVEETNEPEMKPCCQRDSLYPAMTLGRRRCRRGHSIRRTGKARPTFCGHFPEGGPQQTKENQAPTSPAAQQQEEKQQQQQQQRHSYGSDDSDDFDKLLKYNDYDATSSLANEILPYFELQLHKKTSSSLGSLGDLKDEDEDEGEPLSLMPTINSNPSAHPDADFSLDASPAASEEDPAALGLRRNGVCSDGEEDFLEPDDLYFRQASILNMLHRTSMRKMANISLSSDESSLETTASLPQSLPLPLPPFGHQVQSSISSSASSTAAAEAGGQPGAGEGQQSHGQSQGQGHSLAVDSDEGSISSGCETASTATANQDDLSLRYRQSKQQHQLQRASAESSLVNGDGDGVGVGPVLAPEAAEEEEEDPVSAEDIYQRLESRLHGRHGSDATTFSSSSSITLKMGGSSPTASETGLEGSGGRKARRACPTLRGDGVGDGDSDGDSECSDESGYVEFQERDGSARAVVGQPAARSKPLPPPKPLPRRLLGTTGATTAV